VAARRRFPVKAASRFRAALFVGGLVAGAIYLHSSRDASRGLSAPSAGTELLLHALPEPLPDSRFEDGMRNSVKLSDFRGRIVLLNIWATWCAPCREEMPTLDRLQAILGGPDFEVVALSVDRNGLEPVKRFLSGMGIENLRIYLDTNSVAVVDSGILLGIPISTSESKLSVFGIPTTLLIDRDGRELGRLIGPAEWDSPEMITLIQRQRDRNRHQQMAPIE
jgi:thiol-disulfide isomerase/thioredoxin